ncbi:MAG: hypothetical protein QW520_08385 [Methanomassiliicoccales archaeon]
MRPEWIIYLIASSLILLAIIVSYFIQLKMVGIVLFVMGVITFLLPSMRSGRRSKL